MNEPNSSLPVEIDCLGVKSKLDGGDEFIFLDCREKDEYERVAIPGTQLLPMSEIQERVGELDEHRETHIIVSCHHGGRSLRVAMWLRQQGFANVQSMAGGIDHWAVQIDQTLARY